MDPGSNCLIGVGVSGCGKTTAQFGIAKKYFALYFECTRGRVLQRDIQALHAVVRIPALISYDH